MDNIDVLIENELLQHENFDKETYARICETYGKKNVIKYFGKKYITIDKDKLDEFFTKYHTFYEKIEEKETINDNDFNDIIESASFNDQSLSVLKQYIDDIKNNKTLSPQEEKETFTKLESLQQKIIILKIIDSLEFKIDFATLFVSIKDEKQIKSLIKLYKAKYNGNAKPDYEYLINNKNNRDIIKKYLELYSEKNRPLSKKEIFDNFNKLNIKKTYILSPLEYDEQIDILIDFLNTVRKLEYHNLKLVISIAKHKARQMPIEDLIQEGNVGLRKAILKFNAEKGYKFSTYATWWINQCVNRFIMNQRDSIRKPVHVEEQIRKYRFQYNILLLKLGRNPTLDETAEALNISKEDCIEIEKLSVEPISLNAQVGEDENSTMIDFVAEDGFEEKPSLEEDYERKCLKVDIDKVLATLTPKEADVIRNRFGLDGLRPKTLEELGNKYGVTRERIRQIEAKAIKKMRSPKNSRRLHDYYM